MFSHLRFKKGKNTTQKWICIVEFRKLSWIYWRFQKCFLKFAVKFSYWTTIVYWISAMISFWTSQTIDSNKYPPTPSYLLKTTTGKNHLKLKRMYAKYSIQMVLDRLHFSMVTSQKLFQLNCKCVHHIHQILQFVLYRLYQSSQIFLNEKKFQFPRRL